MRYTFKDITLVYGIRAQEYNPWVLERLELVAKHYSPLPKVVVVDFGSEGRFKESIEYICSNNDFVYKYVPDFDVFSPAIARNSALEQIDTDLVFFNDIDCFWTEDFFQRLSSLANVERLDKYWDKMINLPVYHLTEDATNFVMSSDEDSTLSYRMEVAAQKSLTSWKGDVVDFVAPYSNVFLIRKDYFSYTGGYNATFRGHGSEDFEFLIRYASYSKYLPTPQNYDKDFYSPLRDAYYSDFKEYKGFRRQFELLSSPSELYGLKIVHLYHPKPAVSDWVAKNDWKRSNFNIEIEKCIKNPHELLEQDWLERDKRVLVLLKHKDQYEYFLPLRLAGYKIELLLGEQRMPTNTVDKIKQGYYDAVAIFNPYMKSHASIRPYFDLAKLEGVKTIVIERGALPSTWYYSPEVAYADEDYSNNVFLGAEFIDREVERASNIIDELLTGGKTLEKLSDYDATYKKYQIIASLSKRSIFIPLQLHDDMAVTRFTEGFQSYEDYYKDVSRIYEMIDDDVVIFIKPHPLSNNDISFDSPNVIVCDSTDNIHALLELVDNTICYNSGVGLLSLLHGNNTFTIGNSFYSHANGLAVRCLDIPEALNKISQKSFSSVSEQVVKRFFTWLINRKYSYFLADSVMKDFGDRKSHAYKNIIPLSLNIDSYHLEVSSSREKGRVFKSSYLSAKLNIYHKPVVHNKNENNKQVALVENKNSNSSIKPSSISPIEKKIKLKRKLARDPYNYFNDIKNPLYRPIKFFFIDKYHGPICKKMLNKVML